MHVAAAGVDRQGRLEVARRAPCRPRCGTPRWRRPAARSAGRRRASAPRTLAGGRPSPARRGRWSTVLLSKPKLRKLRNAGTPESSSRSRRGIAVGAVLLHRVGEGPLLAPLLVEAPHPLHPLELRLRLAGAAEVGVDGGVDHHVAPLRRARARRGRRGWRAAPRPRREGLLEGPGLLLRRRRPRAPRPAASVSPRANAGHSRSSVASWRLPPSSTSQSSTTGERRQGCRAKATAGRPGRDTLAPPDPGGFMRHPFIACCLAAAVRPHPPAGESGDSPQQQTQQTEPLGSRSSPPCAGRLRPPAAASRPGRRTAGG